MRLHRRLGDAEPLRNLSVVRSRAHEERDLALARGEEVEPPRQAPSRPRVRTGRGQRGDPPEQMRHDVPADPDLTSLHDLGGLLDLRGGDVSIAVASGARHQGEHGLPLTRGRGQQDESRAGIQPLDVRHTVQAAEARERQVQKDDGGTIREHALLELDAVSRFDGSRPALQPGRPATAQDRARGRQEGGVQIGALRGAHFAFRKDPRSEPARAG